MHDDPDTTEGYNPLISIIIATYNAEETINKTIESILEQTYQNFEIIIIDGQSKDQTVNIVKRYKEKIAHLISEPDQGIYDAWNKGIKFSQGSWISFLGSGDTYLKDGLFEYIKYIRSSSANLEFVSSQIEMVDSSGNHLFKVGSNWEWPKFLKFMTTSHGGAFHSRSLFQKYGSFDTSYKIAGDYELLLRAKDDLNTGFFPITTVHMLHGGISNSFHILKETRRLKVHTGGLSKHEASAEFYVNYTKKIIRFIFDRLGIYIFIK